MRFVWVESPHHLRSALYISVVFFSFRFVPDDKFTRIIGYATVNSLARPRYVNNLFELNCTPVSLGKSASAQIRLPFEVKVHRCLDVELRLLHLSVCSHRAARVILKAIVNSEKQTKPPENALETLAWLHHVNSSRTKVLIILVFQRKNKVFLTETASS